MAQHQKRSQRSRRNDYRRRRRSSVLSTKALQNLASIQARVVQGVNAEDAVDFLPALFTHFPQLIDRIPWISLRSCELPSLPRQLRRSQHLFGQNYVFWKEEAEDSDFLPDNSARKLEFIFGKILEEHPKLKRIIISDYVDSPFGMNATQLALALNLKPELFLLKAKLSSQSLQKIENFRREEVKLRFFDKYSSLEWAQRQKRFWGKFFPNYVMEFRGICFEAVLAYLSAMLELKDFISAGLLPSFDILFVPVDTGTSFLGLELGRRLAGFTNMKVVGLSTRERPEDIRENLVQIGQEGFRYLSEVLKQEISDEITEKDLNILSFDDQDMARNLIWLNRFVELESKVLDLQRSAPALIKMSRFMRESKMENKKVLFWNTFSGMPVNEMNVDYINYKWPTATLKRWERTPELDAFFS